MKNIFIRAGMSPFESFPAEKILLNNSIGTNVGNFLYLNGILRNITQSDTVITPTYYKKFFSAADIDKINQTQDIFIIPLADAFRKDFAAELRGLTQLIKSLTIPCVVIGVGLRSPYEPDFSEPFPFDDDVKNFVKAVLDKSSSIGVRGQITADYLSHLGFKEGRDHIAIGCPSLYTNGDTLNVRTTEITKESLVCLNSSPTTPDHVQEFIFGLTKEFTDWHYIPQVRSELRLLLTGTTYKVKAYPLFPTRITDETYRTGKSMFFLNTSTWIEYLAQADLSIGSRLHGNIAALLAGTPNILIPKDARTRELTAFHHLSQISADNIHAGTNIWELIEQTDFKEPCAYQKDNFAHFLSFLETNNIPHIYQGGTPERIPYEERLKNVDMQPPVHSFALCSLEEMADRFDSFYPKYDKQLSTVKKEKNALQEQLTKLETSDYSASGFKNTLRKIKQFF